MTTSIVFGDRSLTSDTLYVRLGGWKWINHRDGMATLELTLEANGDDADAMWRACEDLLAEIQTAIESARDDDQSDAAEVVFRFGGSTGTMHIDVLGGSLAEDIGFGLEIDHPYMMLMMKLDCRAELRGEPYVWPPGPTVTIDDSSEADPSVITVLQPHGLTSGERVRITGHSGSTPSIDGIHIVTVIDATSFSIPIEVTTSGSGGTARRTVVIYADDEAELDILDVPGDVDALTQVRLRDVSTSGAINWLLIGRQSRRKGLGILDLICDAEAGGTYSSTEADEDAIGGEVERYSTTFSESGLSGSGAVTLSNDAAWNDTASLARPTVDTNGVYRVWQRCIDSSNLLTPPTGLRVRATEAARPRQRVAATGTSGTASATWDMPTLDDSTLVMYLMQGNTTATPDDGDFSLAQGAADTNARAAIWVHENAPSESGAQTATLGASTLWHIVIEEWRGLKASFANNPVDAVASNQSSGNVTSLSVGPTGTPSQAEEVVLVAFAAAGGTIALSTSGYTTETFGSGTRLTGYKRIRAAEAQTAAITCASGRAAGVVVTFEVSDNAGVVAVAPADVDTQVTVAVAAFADADTYSAISRRVETVIPAGYFMALDWHAGRGTVDHYGAYINTGTGWRVDYTDDDAETWAVGWPLPEATATASSQSSAVVSQVRTRAMLASGVATGQETEAVYVQIANGEPEWLDTGIAKLPPARSPDGGSAPAWLIHGENRYILGSLGEPQMFDIDAFALIPALEPCCIVEYPGLDNETARVWVIDTRRDGGVSAWLEHVSTGAEAGQLRLVNGSGYTLAAGDNRLPFLMGVAGRVAADPNDNAMEVQIIITPRYTRLGSGSV